MDKIIVTSEEELIKSFQKVLEEYTPPAKEEEEKFLSKKEAAEFLRMGLSSVDNLRRKGIIRSYKGSGTVLFLKSELIEDIKKSAVDLNE